MADDRDRSRRFMGHFLPAEGRLRALVHALVPGRADAEDVLQEACAVLWQKFDEFQEGTNFPAWALRIARYQVMAFYTTRRRNRARLSDETLEALGERLARWTDSPSDYAVALDGCLPKLAGSDRELLELRYRREMAVDDLARRAGRSVFAVYKALDRIHGQLLDCVRRRLGAPGGSA